MSKSEEKHGTKIQQKMESPTQGNKTTNNRTSWLTTVGTGTISDIKGTVTIYSVIGCPLMPPYLGTATDVDLDVVCVPIKGNHGGRRINSNDTADSQTKQPTQLHW